MKTNSTSRSAFFNPRALIGFVLCSFGLLLALAGLTKSVAENPAATSGKTENTLFSLTTGTDNMAIDTECTLWTLLTTIRHPRLAKEWGSAYDAGRDGVRLVWRSGSIVAQVTISTRSGCGMGRPVTSGSRSPRRLPGPISSWLMTPSEAKSVLFGGRAVTARTERSPGPGTAQSWTEQHPFTGATRSGQPGCGL